MREQITTARKPAVWVAATLAISLLGSANGVVAAAHFNRLAAQNHLRYRAVARALTPDDALSAAVRAGLLSDHNPGNGDGAAGSHFFR